MSQEGLGKLGEGGGRLLGRGRLIGHLRYMGMYQEVSQISN